MRRNGFCEVFGYRIRGVPRGLKGGGGRNLKPSVFRSKSSEEQKKVITSSDCPLYVYHLCTSKVLCICLRGEGARPSRPLDTPLPIKLID